ncbi:Sec-independent protein translocase protein TatB [Parasphingopyxis sp.]|uniref:Sec-independent protein translocase protein TatB n=1 Tax=Parasphingopyxis sp. TaxID=1920299 RepID=UPI0026025E22|nr:Sec-independent protein translocase protein TatB [Parasphingopyxis sp.]
MFDIGAIELLLVAAVALIIIGPKDLPIAMRTAGRWLGQLRAMTGHFKVGIDAMIREAEIEEQEKVWAEKNAQIMRDHPPEKYQDKAGGEHSDDAQMKPLEKPQAAEAAAEAEGTANPETPAARDETDEAESQLPLLPDEPDPDRKA